MAEWPVVGTGVMAEEVLLNLGSPTYAYGKCGALEEFSC